MTTSLDIAKILELLPHRYPFLLVDKVIHLEPGKHIHAIKNVTINEPFFVGHFPQKPVMPGVLIIESMAQTAALLTFGTEMKRDPNTLYYFVGIDEARFKRVVGPGDTLHIHVECERYIRGIWKFNAKAMVDDQVTCQAKLMCTVKQMDEQ